MPMANRPSSPTDSEKTITYDSEGEYVETVMYMPCKMCRGLHSFPTKYYLNPTIEKSKVSFKLHNDLQFFIPDLV